MRSRRGSSRGRASRPHSSSDADSPLEEAIASHFDAARSKRRRVSTYGSPSAHHNLPSQPTPTPHVAFCHSSQRVEFNFVCSSERPILTAYIIVSLQEEKASSVQPTQVQPTPQPSSAHDRPAHDTPLQVHWHAGKAKELAFDAPVTTDEDDSSGVELWCRIVEEPLPSADYK